MLCVTMRTFETSREDCLKICWLYRSVRFSTQKFLFERTTSLPEMEEEEFHQSRLCICTEDLLKSIDSQKSLILKPGSWLATIAFTDSFILLLYCQKRFQAATW